MSVRGRRRVSELLTGVASLTFPKARRADGRVVRDCARDAVDAAGLRALPRECLSLAIAGLRARPREAALELRRAPWREALSVLTLPLAATVLVVWVFGFVPRYDHWPLGEGWALLLGGSLLAVVGAALRLRWLTALAASAVLVAAASPYVGYGTHQPGSSITPSFFYGYGVDIGAASLLPTLLLVAGALSFTGSRRPTRAALGRLAVGVAPAVVAAIYLLPAPSPEPTLMHLYSPPDPPRLVLGSPYPWPWIWPSRTLLAALGIALGVIIVVAWRSARRHPDWALASGLVLASVAYPLAWKTFPTASVPYWAYEAPYYWAAAAIPLLLALTLMRRAGRASPAPG